ncbi:MAG: Fe-S cluster assembly ATPase SufC [Patescibacteria group bacterium]|jgi:Fe-S cluster assembly ATP-binding protein
MSAPLLSINNLTVVKDEVPILSGCSLTVPKGEVHVIVGQNGSGKSTLAATLAGKPGYQITQGSINYLGKDLLTMTPEVRAGEGIFLAFQYPVEIPGLSMIEFLRASTNAVRGYRGEASLEPLPFLDYVRSKLKVLKLGEQFLERSVNDGFSGGEKKRNEILQLLLLEPRLAILDETDSGLDADALRTVAQVIQELRSPEESFLIITHYAKLLSCLTVNRVHVMHQGKIACSGGTEIITDIERHGYAGLFASL